MKTLIFIFIACFLSSFLSAVTINVPADQPTIQAGIDAAINGDIVLVQPGTYVENIDYNGKRITVGSLFLTTQEISYISSTIIDGSSSGSVVIFNSSEDSTAVLSGFTITNGFAPVSGGGIFLEHTHPSLNNLIITGNTATHGGGIFGSFDSNPSLENVTITGNTASSYGGGICIDGNPKLKNITISGNSANVGGGIYCADSSPDLNNVTIIGNSASGTYGYGGGIYCFIDCNPSLQNVTMSNNSASIGGGIYCHTDANPELTNSILWDNSPQEIYLEAGSSVIATYSDIEGSWAGTGNIDSDPLFVNPGSDNYQLQAGSPCIDAGDPAYPLDPDGTIVEMGAYFFNQYNGSTLHISPTGSDITGSGTEQHPFATIQHGINYSSNTNTVLVHPGTYFENINYEGKLITLGSLFFTTQDPSYISSTIIDGNNSGSVVTFENGENSTAILTGFTITNGLAPYGSGIYCEDASPSIMNVTISGNSAIYGGGIYCYDYCSPNLLNVTITDNTASDSGGGIVCEYSSPVVTNSILWDNSPNEISNYSGSITVVFSDIEGGWTGSGNIDSDPQFVDPGNVDYNLQLGSPCIDTGNPAYPLDPDGTVKEMGAFYFPQVPPEADFIADTTSGNAILTVNFTDTSIPGSVVIDEWFWDFGDGNTSSLQNPVNEYLLQGNYTVSLTVTDIHDFTDTETKVDYINVFAYFGPVWHVSTTGSDITGNGSINFPFATIQHGINTSSNTDTVLVQSGTYVENINYNGKLISVGSLFLTTQDTTHISTTIIDGNSSGRVVIFNNGEDSTAVLSGFTVTNGYASGSPPANWGGGIYCESSNPSMQYLTITENSANTGGGIFLDSSGPNLQYITLSNNSVSHHGGGLYCYNSSNPILQNVTIASNSSGYYGGGIMCYLNSSPNIENVTISNNTASNGGGIYCQAGSYPSLVNTISWNDSPQEIFIHSGSVTATYSDIEGGFTGTGNIDSNPLFADPGNGNYYLQLGSPCIDAGDSASPLDPDGTIVDMGAYFYPKFPPTADFAADITIGILPLTVNFSDLSIPGSETIDQWFWDFGDGNNSALQNPAHEYLIPGSYTVSLTVTDYNDTTDTEIKTQYITIAPPSYSGSTWHISPTGSDPWGNGSTQFPFATIQYGINASSNSDIVLVQPGTYMGCINFNGKDITVGSLILTTLDPTYISSTIIDGDAYACAVTFIGVEDTTAVLTGFTITNGSAEFGGGIRCDDSSPKLKNLVITGNTADFGSGVYCDNSSNPILENLSISGNNASTNGGGISCYNNSNPTLISSILWNDTPQEIYIDGTCSIIATYSDIEGGWTGAGNIDSDPLFISSSNDNFNLFYNSPCIDAGHPHPQYENPDGTRADMGAYYFDQSIGASEITEITDIPNDQGRSVIVTWQRSPWDIETSALPITGYSLWEKYPYELDRESAITTDIYEAFTDQDVYYQREDTTWVNIAYVPAMQWEQYSAHAVTYFDSTTVGDYMSYFFVSAHSVSPSLYFISSVESGYSVDNIAPDGTDVYIAQNGSNIGLNWDEVEYGTFQGNSYPEINGIWYKIYAGDLPDFVCDEAHLIDTVTDLNYNYPLTGEEKKFFKIVVSDQPEAGRISNVFKKPAGDYHNIEK